jgi:hypothetical protein
MHYELFIFSDPNYFPANFLQSRTFLRLEEAQ